MFNFETPESELLKGLLPPLLEDFQYWFEQSRLLLETHEIEFLGIEQQADLLARVEQARQEVAATQMLVRVTEGQVGVDTAVLLPWHQLVTECWQVALHYRLKNPDQ